MLCKDDDVTPEDWLGAKEIARSLIEDSFEEDEDAEDDGENVEE